MLSKLKNEEIIYFMSSLFRGLQVVGLLDRPTAWRDQYWYLALLALEVL